MLFKAALACEQAVYSRHILASANHRDFLMELAFQVIYISLSSLSGRFKMAACINRIAFLLYDFTYEKTPSSRH